MAFARPSLAELITRIGGDLRGRLSIGGPLLRRAMVDVLSAVWAGGVHTLYGFLDWLSLQLFADTSDDEQLLRQAALYGITPTPATFATGNVTCTGTTGEVFADAILKLDSATSYIVTTGGTISGGTCTIIVKAVLAGTAANIPEGTTLAFESPIPGVNALATVGSGDIAGGNDQGTVDEVRARLLLRLQEPPEGGADQDYEAWMLAVAGVTRAWVYANELGLGTVVGRFVRDNDVSIFPDAGEVTAVQDYVDSQRPVTAEFTAAAPTSLAVAFTIHVVPDNADTRAAVTAELDDLMFREGEPGDGVSRGTILLSAIRTAIGVAEGVTDYTLTVPSANVVPSAGQLPTRGTITWA